MIEGLHHSGCATIGTGVLEWFNTSSASSSVLAELFDHFCFSGNTCKVQA